MTRGVSRALQGAALAVGAPLGWLAIRVLDGAAVAAELAENEPLYLYMLFGSMCAFGVFGLLLGEREARLEDLAVTDSLTGLRNARYFHTRLAEEHAESERTGQPLAVVVLDLDHFKPVNDRYGHLVGNEVLIGAARAIESNTRQGETSARVGGEEFALLLPNSAAEEAEEAAERVRGAIAGVETRVTGLDAGTIRITASAGVATSAELPGATGRELYRAADDALYRAKAAGRDRTVTAAAARGNRGREAAATRSAAGFPLPDPGPTGGGRSATTARRPATYDR